MKCNGSISADEITLLGWRIGIRIQRVERFVAFSAVRNATRIDIMSGGFRECIQNAFPSEFYNAFGVNNVVQSQINITSDTNVIVTAINCLILYRLIQQNYGYSFKLTVILKERKDKNSLFHLVLLLQVHYRM